MNDTNILIVDDKPENLIVLESILENMDCNIIKAGSGNQALSLMLDYDFALVLLDVQMPEMDGFETASLMRGSERTRYIPIIFVTAISKDQKCIFKGYDVGAVDYLFKPIEPIILQSKVKVFLELYNQRKLLEQQAVLLEMKIKELMELREINNALERICVIDDLTGIANRRYFDQYLKISWKNAIRSRKPISLIMADVDNFKAYNDNYGHLKGDQCLVQVANAISASVKRPTDFACRYGGEEFTIILPETDINGAMHVAEETRKNIENLNIRHEFSDVSQYVTISLGVTSITPTLKDAAQDFINAADKALYYAKQGGRNRVAKS